VPEPISAPRDAVDRLGRMPAFADLSAEALTALADAVEWLRVHGGEAIVEQGDPGDCAYFIVRGRARVTTRDADGVEKVVGDLGPGQPVGELALIIGVTRTATVRAARDTELVRLTAHVFDRFVQHHPDATLPMVGVLARRLERTLAGARPAHDRVSTIAVLDTTEDSGAASDAFIDALGSRVPIQRVRVTKGRDQGLSLPALIAAIDAQDERQGVTVLDVDVGGGPAVQRGLRQADAIVVVVDATAPGHAREALAILEELRLTGCAPAIHALVVQPQHRAHPVNTARLVEGFDAHHHVRVGVASDFARAARHLLGLAVGLVLGGGGARGMAHVGAYRVLREAGVPIDAVGGSSSGGIVSAQVAAGWTPDELQTRNREGFAKAHISRAFTLPMLSLLSARTAAAMLDTMFGDLDLEDLWLPCFVTTVDLTTCRLALQSRGPVARWTRATASPPGLWPPVPSPDGSLHVDGALLDNLPVVPMRDRGAARVIAVSVSRQSDFGVVAGTDAPTPLAQAKGIARKQYATGFPNLVQVLNRSALVTGLAGHATARAQTDIYVEPSVETFALGEYERVDEIAPLGEEAMRIALDKAAPMVASWV
jgi:NTE family protein